MKRFIISWLVLLIVLVPLVGCGTNTEREAILAFTRQALEIEGKRNDLVNCYAPNGMLPATNWIVSQTFLTGIPPNKYAGIEVPPGGLEGMTSLSQKMTLLSSPQSLQSIKDALSQIYDDEIEVYDIGRAASAAYESAVSASKDYADSNFVSNSRYGPGSSFRMSPSFLNINFSINKDNLDTWKEPKTKTTWYRLQSFRRDTYIQWAQLLKQHGIDPAKEGFTDLIQANTPAPIIPTPTPTTIPVTANSTNLEKWEAVKARGGSRAIIAFFKIWNAGKELSVDDENQLKSFFNLFPYGQTDYEAWKKQPTAAEEDLLKAIFEQYPFGQTNFEVWKKQTMRQIYENSVLEQAQGNK